jgi:hypothetical protein
MSVEPCDWCQYNEFLNAYYDDILKGHDFLVGDPEDFPKLNDPNKYVAGMLEPELKRIKLRKDLQGQYMYVPFSRSVKYKGKDITIAGIAPIHKPEFVAAHECQHAKRYKSNQSQDEDLIDRLALNDCIDFYVKKKLESFSEQNMDYMASALNVYKNLPEKKSSPLKKLDYLV